MAYFQVNEQCNGCLACVQNCPANALDSKDTNNSRVLYHNMSKCARCGNCWRICPREAIEFQHILENRWDRVVEMELVRCKVCNEPVYTGKLADFVSERLKKDTEPFCGHHQHALESMSRAYYPGKGPAAKVRKK